MENNSVLHLKRTIQTNVDIPLTVSEFQFLLDDCEDPDVLEQIGTYALRLAKSLRQNHAESRNDFYQNVRG